MIFCSELLFYAVSERLDFISVQNGFSQTTKSPHPAFYIAHWTWRYGQPKENRRAAVG